MKKIILNICLICFTIILKSQNHVYFNSYFINEHLNKRLFDIQTNIIQKSIKGEINCFHNDSLSRTYNKSQILSRCLIYDKNLNIDTSIIKKTLLKGLIFQSNNKIQKEITFKKKLNSIYILNKNGWQIGCFSWKDIEKKLDKNDVNFLISLFKIKSYDILQFELNKSKNYKYTFEKLEENKYDFYQNSLSNKSYQKVSELDIKLISNLIIYDFWHNSILKEFDWNKKMFLNNIGEIISLNDFEIENTDTIKYPILKNITNNKDSFYYKYDSINEETIYYNISKPNKYIETGKDTIFYNRFYLNSNNPIIKIYGNKKIEFISLNFLEYNKPEIKLNLDWKFVKKYNSQKWLINLLEDYYRYNYISL